MDIQKPTRRWWMQVPGKNGESICMAQSMLIQDGIIVFQNGAYGEREIVLVVNPVPGAQFWSEDVEGSA